MFSGGDAADVAILQPVPMGDNLVNCLIAIVEQISELNGKVADFAEIQGTFNSSIMTHTHPMLPIPAPPFLVAGPSVRLGSAGIVNKVRMIGNVHLGLVAHKLSIAVTEINYLRDFGSQWICSENVRTT